MKQSRSVTDPGLETQSTFLVGESCYANYLLPRVIKGMGVSAYLHRLIIDPELNTKLGYLKPKKWKKTYQEEGQNLKRLNFFPMEADWARLSIISNATGFSRCYIFVFLMLVDLGVLKLPKKGTPLFFAQESCSMRLVCSILLDERRDLLTRVLQT